MLFIVCPLAVVCASVYMMLLRSLPMTQGDITLSPLGNEVRVERDSAGVPHILASKDRDAFFALGFVHAQDRLWQMDYRRRQGRGRLSEILGARALESDKLMRTLGLYRAADEALRTMPAAERECLHSYTQGVNAFIDAGYPLPVEFRYYDIRPDRWSPADSLLMIKLLALSLSANYRNELSNQTLVKHLGDAAASELLGPLNATMIARHRALSEPVPHTATLERLTRIFENEFGFGAEGIGSNAWAVSGALTASGFPLLASDPHLRQQLPSIFYLARIRGDRLNVSGATVPGVPVVIFGHNAFAAWGATNLAADVQDLYALRVSLDREQYEWNGQWRSFDVREEWIHVAGEFPVALREPYKPVRWLARATVHGPLLSDVLGDVEQPLSLRWTALDRNDLSFKTFLGLNYAENLDQFRAALSDHGSPALNFVYADRAGNIASLAAGRIPVRRAGQGVLPVPGWNDNYEWNRYLAAEELPALINPKSGVIVSANQRVHAEDYPHLISSNWQPAYRAQRIESLLRELSAQGHKLDIADFVKIQNDVLDTQGAELLSFYLRQQGRNARERELLDHLRNWDFRMSESSIGASIYYSWSRHFMERLVSDRLRVGSADMRRFTELHQQAEVFRPEFLHRVATGELRHWCGNTATSCDQIALLALDDAAQELSRLAGNGAEDWKWGELHQVHLNHAPFSDHTFLRPFFERELGMAGGRYTVNVAAGDFSKDRGYVKTFGAAFRQIVSLRNVDDSLFVIETGQSGNVSDEHYDDLIPLYRTGRYISMRPDPAENERSTLVMHPRALRH